MSTSYNRIAGHSAKRVAVLIDGIFAVAMTLLGLVLCACWGCAPGKGLLKENTPHEVPAAFCRRIQIAQSPCTIGALLCFFST